MELVRASINIKGLLHYSSSESSAPNLTIAYLLFNIYVSQKDIVHGLMGGEKIQRVSSRSPAKRNNNRWWDNNNAINSNTTHDDGDISPVFINHAAGSSNRNSSGKDSRMTEDIDVNVERYNEQQYQVLFLLIPSHTATTLSIKIDSKIITTPPI